MAHEIPRRRFLMFGTRSTTKTEAARIRRIARFMDEIERCLHAHCIRNELSTALVESFTEEYFALMLDSSEPFTFMTLLEMLCAPSLSVEVIAAFQRKLDKR
jgi:hypothetical protein